MQVILLKKVDGIGDVDDVKEVADGYARNFLLPQHLAVQASSSTLFLLNTRQNKKKKEADHEWRVQRVLADKLDGFNLTIKEKANAKGLLYAAIGPQKLADELLKFGFNVAKTQIQLAPIKEMGQYQARVRLRYGLTAKINIVVTI